MGKAAAIEFLREQLLACEAEQRKIHVTIQAAQARLPQIDAEIHAAKLLLSKHTGQPSQLTFSSPPLQRADQLAEGPSIATLMLKALTEAGKPQRYEQLLAFLATHGKHPTNATLRSTIHQYLKRGKLFKAVRPGVIGLLEWENKS
ncbi:MAG: hypothetical protein A2V62_09975 [Nitrospirae bacterium RBG_19FT_COMBO_58_9]|nr:MAG: hypothetical protein A2V62_09975 [Nitrospirae bacterium RBG_19FT_COMBO_58_9]